MKDITVVSDLGGTNVRFALVENGQVGEITKFKVKDCLTYEEALARFLEQHSDKKVNGLIVAAAGNVVNGKIVGVPANAKLIPDADKIKARIPSINMVEIVNDFLPQAMAVLELKENQYETVNAGKPLENGPVVVVGPGTGCGQSFLHYVGDKYIPVTSEAGQAVVSEIFVDHKGELDAVKWYLEMKFKDQETLTIERLVSGSGIRNLYEALAFVHGMKEETVPSSYEITNMAVEASERPNPEKPYDEKTLALRAHDYFFTFLAAHVYNMAVAQKASGGVYLGGGVMADPNIVKLMKKSPFNRVLFEKTPQNMADYVKDIPIHVIKERDIAFLGLQRLAREVVQDKQNAQNKNRGQWMKKVALVAAAMVASFTVGRYCSHNAQSDKTEAMPAVVEKDVPMITKHITEHQRS